MSWIMERRPTIIDVALKAGVSKSTVSLVLQNSPRVRKETRKLVRATMTEIGYVYNRAAANLRTANVGLVGVVINDLRNPFFTEFATSLQMALSARGYAAVIANTDEDPGLQAQVVGAIVEHGVSALIISPAYGEEATTFDAISQAGIPTMQVLRKVDPRVDLFPFAAPDYKEGSRLATEHLLKAGAKRIAFVGGLEGRDVTRERISGYRAVLETTGMDPIVHAGRASRAFGRDVARLFASEFRDIDAAICFNDLVALGLLSGCAKIGRMVGSSGFRIVGFDDIKDCGHTYPSLTSVRCDITGFGNRIAHTILAWIEDGIVPLSEVRTSVELIVRDSSGGST